MATIIIQQCQKRVSFNNVNKPIVGVQHTIMVNDGFVTHFEVNGATNDI